MLKMGIGLMGDRLPGLFGRGFAPVGENHETFEWRRINCTEVTVRNPVERGVFEKFKCNSVNRSVIGV